MRKITVADYDAKETVARLSASYPALRCFYPVAFGQANFPTRVTEERELIRYADIMYETISRREYMEERHYSETEVAAILQLVGQVRRVTADLFGRTVQPLMCLFPPLPILRAIELVARMRGRRLRIFEIGPGSGYLGGYLLNAGHSYSSMDVTQALYLWQNRLFGSIAPHGSEWAAGEQESPCIHVPWWIYSGFHKGAVPPIEADIVVCDAAMGEMEAFGLVYNIRIRTARAMIDASDCGAFIFQNIGEERVNRLDFVQHWFAKFGFLSRRIDGVSVYSPPGRTDDIFSTVATLPHLGPEGKERKPPKDFMTINESELLESYAFFNYLSYGL